ncbi:hypothetical protein CAPTEDRAFT_157516 [Capitella teleta]|uniref:Uncharacterized protein n=1 Tax=Capitella teleta TaxID=283909 RepID=R7T4T6_CAPTE|nr:hypothetical protein CAPTEDRAFT_157516 [Capitella teleta]|eukprot:ELT88107.1 hypothetical protein CAPTEDRAFT_157516 [Capitella teleta]
MAVDIVGLVVVIVFYVAILIFGILAARWFEKKNLSDVSDEEKMMVAGRKIGSVVGTFTIIATLCGGGFLNGTAEGIMHDGLAWTIFPFAMALGYFIAGWLYAGKMREARYLTMLDPLQEKFSNGMVAIIFLGSLLGDVFWSASILGALGEDLSVIIDLNVEIAIWVSAAIAVIYTGFGKMVSVALTDIVQLMFMVIGMFLCLPFAITNENVENISSTFDTSWGGEIPKNTIAAWIDLAIAMTLGTIPWQTYFQRVLAMKSPKHAQWLSLTGGIGSLIFTIPPIIIGAIGASTNWNATELNRTLTDDDAAIVLPLVVHYLTPRPVAVIALAALCAAVMSSIDSAVLSCSTLFTHNVYKLAFRPRATQFELVVVQTVSVIVAGVASSLIAIYVNTIYGLFVLAGDVVYVIVFPQLTAAVFTSWVNGYGSFFGFVIGLVLRLGAGEPFLNFQPFIEYPYYTEDDGQLFPFRFLAMMCNLLGIYAFSYLFKVLFEKDILPRSWDVCHVIKTAELDTGMDKQGDEKMTTENGITNAGYSTDDVVGVKMIKL